MLIKKLSQKMPRLKGENLYYYKLVDGWTYYIKVDYQNNIKVLRIHDDPEESTLKVKVITYNFKSENGERSIDIDGYIPIDKMEFESTWNFYKSNYTVSAHYLLEEHI